MKKFKIAGFLESEEILITNSESLSSAATFEESVTIQEHMKSTLNFKISDKLSTGEINPFIGLIFPGARIRLYLEDGFGINIFDFIVKSISTEFYKDLIIYSISCEDFASSIYSKESQGLSLNYTGTIKELAEEVLVQSYKNLGYRDLNKNFLDILSYSSTEGLPTITSNGISKNFTELGFISVNFIRTNNTKIADYIFYGNILDISSNTTITINQYDGNMSFLESNNYTTNSIGLISIPFTLRTATAFLQIKCSNTAIGTFNIVDLKFKLDETQYQSIIDQSLKILINEEDFISDSSSISYYKKATINLENSNLYNAFIELAKLFNAEARFNYIDNYVQFINKTLFYSFKGYKLSPTFNLLSLSRDESFDEFSSVLNIRGNENVYSIFPNIPNEFLEYFYDCIKYDFSGNEYFQNYTNTNMDYTPGIVTDFYGAAQYIKENYIIDDSTKKEKELSVDSFANACDLVPNFENTLFSLEYFKNINAISNSKYETFKNLIENNLRKLNIKLRVYSNNYLNADSLLSSKESEIDFITNNLTVEDLNLKDIDNNFLFFKCSGVNNNTDIIINNSFSNNTEIALAIKDFNDSIPQTLNTSNKYYIVNASSNKINLSLTTDGEPINIGNTNSIFYIVIPIISDPPASGDLEINNSEWIGLWNQRQNSLDNIYNYTTQLLTTMGIVTDINLNPISLDLIYNNITEKYNLNSESYTYLLLTIYGYYNIYKNGVKQKIDSIKLLIDNIVNDLKIKNDRINELNLIIEDPSVTEYQKRGAETEKAGLSSYINSQKYKIGEYDIDPYNPSIKGSLQRKLYYLNIINNYMGSYTYYPTLIDYSVWQPGSLTSGWSSTGMVFVDTQTNKDNNSDYMVSFTTDIANGAIITPDINFSSSNYRIAGLLKVPGYTNGLFKLYLSNQTNGDRLLGNLNIASVSTTRWIAFEYKNNLLKCYLFPSNSELSTISYTVSFAATDKIKFVFEDPDKMPIYLYRPRVEEINSKNPNLDDMYSLYDNPIMYNYSESKSIDFNYMVGLYDLLYNEDYQDNVNIKKKELLSTLYKEYENFIVEGYYENSDEIDSNGLLNQALIAFEKFKYPKIDYGISVIDLSSLDNYKYLNINVGDKIAIGETEDRLYKSYQILTEDNKYLQILSINYDLRKPEGTQITVTQASFQDDPIKKILQYIIKATQ